MGVFSRFRDIVSSNLNSMLDKAEDPKKMIRLMIQEMEETLVELKSSCARTMAAAKNVGRELAEVEQAATTWASRAELAVDKGRDDLAREALAERQAMVRRSEELGDEAARLEAMVEASKDDIATLEAKLASAREKQRLLVQRHARASARIKAGEELRKAGSGDAILRFDKFEQRIERLEAEAELSVPRRADGLEGEFALLEEEDGIEAELAAMKQRKATKED